MRLKDEQWNHYYSWRDLLKMKTEILFGSQEELLESSNAECT